MDLLIPVAMAAATLVVLFQILFGGRGDHDRPVRNTDRLRPGA